MEAEDLVLDPGRRFVKKLEKELDEGTQDSEGLISKMKIDLSKMKKEHG